MIKKLYMLIYVVKNAPLVVGMICYLSALERTFARKLTYEGMQVEERIARIGSDDPGSHLGIPISHISARITIKYSINISISSTDKFVINVKHILLLWVRALASVVFSASYFGQIDAVVASSVFYSPPAILR